MNINYSILSPLNSAPPFFFLKYRYTKYPIAGTDSPIKELIGSLINSLISNTAKIINVIITVGTPPHTLYGRSKSGYFFPLRLPGFHFH